MLDYRTVENRGAYFDALYRATLEHKASPGCVYLYLPFLRDHLGWDREQCLWAALVNGLTQNPLTTLRILERLPAPPSVPSELQSFQQWFDEEWPRLSYDVDRRYGKVKTTEAIRSYCRLLHRETGDPSTLQPQSAMLDPDGGSWEDLWEMITKNVVSLGRLSAWSYLEYVRIYGSGQTPSSMLFNDASGSRSHRNGMLFLLGRDELVDDRRAANGIKQRGVKYEAFGKMCAWLERQYDERFERFSNLPDAGRFTGESVLCAFKNSFFGRRYFGCYHDMGYDRLQWYEKNVGRDRNWKMIMEAREALPDWLRLEVKNDGLTITQRAAIFPATGRPYRAEHFIA